MEEKYKLLLSTIQSEGLKRYLLNIGITNEIIDNNVTSLAFSKNEYYYYYDLVNRSKIQSLIVVDQIKGIGRVTNTSWFDILNYGLNERENFNMRQKKFLKQLYYLENNGLENLANEYLKTQRIAFSAFKKAEEIVYFQEGDGNHRVTIAKNLGIQKILATEIDYYEFNPSKYKQYRRLLNTHNNFITFIENTNFILEKIEGTYDDQGIVIEFMDIKYFYFKKYPIDFIKFQHDTNSGEEMVDQLEKIEKELSGINQQVGKYELFYSFFPIKLLYKIKQRCKKRSSSNIAKLIAIQRIFIRLKE